MTQCLSETFDFLDISLLKYKDILNISLLSAGHKFIWCSGVGLLLVWLNQLA